MADVFYFLGLRFTPITLSDKEILEPFLKKYPHCLNGYTFSSLLTLSVNYLYAYHFIDPNTLLIATWVEFEKQFHLLEPIGEFTSNIKEQLLSIISKNSYPLKLFRVCESFIKKNADFCSHFEDLNNPNFANYLYKAHDLAMLKGRNYEKKRNLISQAERLYDWKLKPLTEDCSPQCMEILENIGKNPDKEIVLSLQNELKALNNMFSYFKDLDLKGLIITIEDRPHAFSIYGELTEKIADIYFEKADRNFKGLHQLINRETAKMIMEEGYEFINREEDLGVEGLRQAKMSYFPCKLIPSHILTFRS